jgi:hypothetical protein
MATVQRTVKLSVLVTIDVDEELADAIPHDTKTGVCYAINHTLDACELLTVEGSLVREISVEVAGIETTQYQYD